MVLNRLKCKQQPFNNINPLLQTIGDIVLCFGFYLNRIIRYMSIRKLVYKSFIQNYSIGHVQGQSDEKENLLGLPLMQRVERLIRPRTSSGVIATYGQSSVKRNIQSAKSDGSKSRRINWVRNHIRGGIKKF